MTAKSDPFFSIRSALKNGTPIECRFAWDNSKPHLYGTRAPYYYWDNRLDTSAYRAQQLGAADALRLLTWEVVESNPPAEMLKSIEESPEDGRILYHWRKRLVSINDGYGEAPAIQRPTLGDRLMVTAKAGRVKAWRDNEHHINQLVATWDSFPITSIEAVYIGFRTVFEGWIEKSGYNSEDAGVLHIARTLEVWKFVDHPRHADYYVLPQDTRQVSRI